MGVRNFEHGWKREGWILFTRTGDHQKRALELQQGKLLFSWWVPSYFWLAKYIFSNWKIISAKKLNHDRIFINLEASIELEEKLFLTLAQGGVWHYFCQFQYMGLSCFWKRGSRNGVFTQCYLRINSKFISNK